MRRVLVTILGVVIVLAIWGFFIEPSSLRNESYEISIANWPAACNGIRVAVLSDFRVGSPLNRIDKLDRIIELTRNAQPHLVLLAGDFVIQSVVGGRFTPPEDVAARLRGLSAPMGVWAVLGNHDWWLDAPRVRRALESVGIPVLDDASAPLHRSLAVRSAICDRPHCRAGTSALRHPRARHEPQNLRTLEP